MNQHEGEPTQSTISAIEFGPTVRTENNSALDARHVETTGFVDQHMEKPHPNHKF